MNSTNVFMLHLFFVMASYEPVLVYLYAGFIIANVFSYTTVLDGKRSALGGELAKLGFGLYLLWLQNLSWFGFQGVIVLGFISYLLLSAALTVVFLQRKKQQKPTILPA